MCVGIAWVGAGFALHTEYFRGRIDLEPVWRLGRVGLFTGLAIMTFDFGGTVLWMVGDVLMSYGKLHSNIAAVQ